MGAITVVFLLALTGGAVSHMPTVYEFCSYVVANGDRGHTACDASQCQGRPGKIGAVGPRGFQGTKGEKGARGTSEDLKEQVRFLQDYVDAMRKRMMTNASLKSTLCHLGMKSREIPDSAIRSSSDWDQNHSARLGRMDNRVNKPQEGAWCALRNEVDEWIQVDLTKQTFVAGLVTQGRPQAYNQWVTSYKVSCGTSESNLAAVREGGRDKVFSANRDMESKVVNMFPEPMYCRFVRVYPQTWNNHMSMRLEIIGGACFDIY